MRRVFEGRTAGRRGFGQKSVDHVGEAALGLRGLADVRRDLVDARGEVVLPRGHLHHHVHPTIGSSDVPDVEVAVEYEVEQLVDTGDRLDRRDRVVHRARQAAQGDVDEQPEGEQRILVERAVGSRLDRADEMVVRHPGSSPDGEHDEVTAQLFADRNAHLDHGISGRCDVNEVGYVDLAQDAEPAGPAHLGDDRGQLDPLRHSRPELVCVQHAEQALTGRGDVNDRGAELQRPVGAELQRAHGPGRRHDERESQHRHEVRDVVVVAQRQATGREEHEQADEEGERAPNDRIVPEQGEAWREGRVDSGDDEEQEREDDRDQGDQPAGEREQHRRDARVVDVRFGVELGHEEGQRQRGEDEEQLDQTDAQPAPAA